MPRCDSPWFRLGADEQGVSIRAQGAEDQGGKGSVINGLWYELVDVPLDSPMTDIELAQLDAVEARAELAFMRLLKAEIEQGERLNELKHHPRMLWQRYQMFRTKAGGWKKRRNWHQFVVAHELAESGVEADRLIQLWRDHRMHLGLAEAEV